MGSTMRNTVTHRLDPNHYLSIITMNPSGLYTESYVISQGFECYGHTLHLIGIQGHYEGSSTAVPFDILAMLGFKPGDYGMSSGDHTLATGTV